MSSSTSKEITLSEMHNLASHYHTNLQLRKDIRRDYPIHYAKIEHFKEIGSNFCPRVLQSVESLIRTLKAKNRYDSYAKYIITREESAYSL